MPKPPRIGSRECLSAFTEWAFPSFAGKEATLSCGAARQVVVPNHKEIRTSTLSGILKQAGVTVEEFIENL